MAAVMDVSETRAGQQRCQSHACAPNCAPPPPPPPFQHPLHAAQWAGRIYWGAPPPPIAPLPSLIKYKPKLPPLSQVRLCPPLPPLPPRRAAVVQSASGRGGGGGTPPRAVGRGGKVVSPSPPPKLWGAGSVQSEVPTVWGHQQCRAWHCDNVRVVTWGQGWHSSAIVVTSSMVTSSMVTGPVQQCHRGDIQLGDSVGRVVPSW